MRRVDRANALVHPPRKTQRELDAEEVGRWQDAKRSNNTEVGNVNGFRQNSRAYVSGNAGHLISSR